MPHDSSSRLALAWMRVRDSLWFVPTLAVLSGAVLAVVAVQVPTPEPESRFARLWLFGGGAEGARGVLSAIAGSLITVTGTIFSITIIALQLASSQFTPRLLRSFVADRVNQGVLGVFIGTFTYTLLVLRTIHSSSDEREGFVPQVGVIIAVVLLLVSIGALIVFIDHAARSIQASVILHNESRRTLAHIDTLFPERVGLPGTALDDTPGDDAMNPTGAATLVVADTSGYLTAVETESLWSLSDGATRPPLTVRMELRMGGFAFPGRALASVWPADRVDDTVIQTIREAFVLGMERTPEQDVEFGLVTLSDIALKALSPGINDPTTALHSIDRLTELLGSLATRRLPDRLRSSPDGCVRFVATETPFALAARLAFDQIRHYGAGNPAVASRLLVALTELAMVVPPQARGVLRAQVESVARAAAREIADPSDRAEVDRLALRALAETGEGSFLSPLSPAESSGRT